MVYVWITSNENDTNNDVWMTMLAAMLFFVVFNKQCEMKIFIVATSINKKCQYGE